MLKTYRFKTDVYINGQHVERNMTGIFLLEDDTCHVSFYMLSIDVYICLKSVSL